MSNPEQEAQAFLNDLLRDVGQLVATRLALFRPNLAQATGVLPASAVPVSDPIFIAGITDIVGSLGGFTDPTTDEGDLIYRDGSGIQRLGIGTDDQVLMVVSGEPAWATSAPSGGASYVEYAAATGLSFPGSAETRVRYDTLVSDPDGLVTTGASWVYTCAADGLVIVTAGIYAPSGNYYMFLNRNGARARLLGVLPTGLGTGSASLLVTAGDTLYITLYNIGGSASSGATGEETIYNAVTIVALVV